jgi:hypothetical protein
MLTTWEKETREYEYEGYSILVDFYQCFPGICCFHLQGRRAGHTWKKLEREREEEKVGR